MPKRVALIAEEQEGQLQLLLSCLPSDQWIIAEAMEIDEAIVLARSLQIDLLVSGLVPWESNVRILQKACVTEGGCALVLLPNCTETMRQQALRQGFNVCSDRDAGPTTILAVLERFFPVPIVEDKAEENKLEEDKPVQVKPKSKP